MCRQIDSKLAAQHGKPCRQPARCCGGLLATPPSPTPEDFAEVYLDESDRDENEEEDDRDEVVGVRQ